MIEVKLSQGAKPAHGGILPASKITQSIADARGLGAPVAAAYKAPVDPRVDPGTGPPREAARRTRRACRAARPWARRPATSEAGQIAWKVVSFSMLPGVMSMAGAPASQVG